MKVSFVLNCWFYSKKRKWVLSRQRDNDSNSRNGKPDIFLKTVKRFNIKRTLIIILIFLKSLGLGIAVLFMFNKMLVIVFFINFYSGNAPPKWPFLEVKMGSNDLGSQIFETIKNG